MLKEKGGISMQDIIFVSHCVLNIASKVVMYNEAEMAAEEDLRRSFVSKAVSQGVQLIQLPCPEFIMYGSRRWGHVSDQFDTPFFRSQCRKLLEDYMLQIKEYLSNDRFRILGIVGIDGSPSCGVDYTCYGNWGGNLSDRDDLNDCIATSRLGTGKGILMDEFAKLLKEQGVEVPMVGLFAEEPEKIMGLLEK